MSDTPQKKNTRSVLNIVCIGIPLLILAVFALFRFDKKEVMVTDGQQMNTGWKITKDGQETEFMIPGALAVSQRAVITNSLDGCYSGYVLKLGIKNASVEARFNNDIIYNEDQPQNTPSDVYATKTIELPLYTGVGILNLDLTPEKSDAGVLIKDITIAPKETALIKQVSSGLLQLILSVFIVLCMGICAVVELIRRYSGWQENHLYKLAIFALFAFIYCAANSGLPEMFFGNGIIFSAIKGISLAFMPLYLLSYSEYGNRSGSVGNIVIPLFCINGVFLATGSIVLPALAKYIFIASATLITACAFLCLWGSVTKSRDRNFLEISGYMLIASFCVMTLLSAISVKADLPTISTFLLTLGVLFLTAYQLRSFVSDYKAVIERSEQEALEASEAKGKFLANMSHEIRTPINAILGMDEMILRESGEAAIRNYASDIRSAGRSLLSLVNDILDFSKIESGKMEIIPVEYDVCDLVYDTSNLMLSKAKDKGLEFEISVDPGMPSKLKGDDARIKQVMINLLSNAIKYTDAGTVRLRVSSRTGKNGAVAFHCEVRDTGQGIKKEDMPKLFREFERIEEDKHRTTEGTGLGMSITVKLLSLMGSKLRVKSEYGKGSVFWFDIRQKVIDSTPVGDYKAKTEGRAVDYSYASSFTAPDAKILVVDDNAMNLKVFTSLLKETLVKVTEASSGKECLRYAKKEHYDLIFLDHMMPDMDGIETLKRIKRMKDSPCIKTPVYVLTANAVAGTKKEYLKAGFDGYLSKPIIPEKLEKTIMNTLPKELIKPGKEKIIRNQAATDEIEIQGVDPDYIGLHFTDKESRMSALESFYENAGAVAAKLNNFYDRMQDEGTEQYRICVHAMKSSAASIGAMQLYGLALSLENMAKNGRTEEIGSLHDYFIQEWNRFAENLGDALGCGAEEKKEANKEEIVELLHSVCNSLKDMDVDTADVAIKELSTYSFEETEKGLFEELKIAVYDINTEAAEDVATKWEKML